jgi:HAE1 family hydrophobic/amphiphilic exporter-1/multidrug efflux pump
VLATGAGAAGRHSIGTGVFGGMLAATFLAIFFVPLFFVLVRKLSDRVTGQRKNTANGAPAPAQREGGL